MKIILYSVILVLPAMFAQAGDGSPPDTRIPYDTSYLSAPAYAERWSDFLPIWGREARAQGYVLPRPFGISLGYLRQEQPFDVDGIEGNGVDVKSSGLAVVDQVDNQEGTITLRFDAWVLPFLNLYGILGKTDGRAEGPLAIDPGVILGDACRLPGVDCTPIYTTFELDYTGDVVGGGITIAGGYKDFFGMIDSNYTSTNLDISSTDARAWVTSARLGWNGDVGIFAGSLWVGAMYQSINQSLDLLIPVGDQQLNVVIDQHTAAPWNTLLGGRWEFGHGFEVLLEFGIGQRRSNMANITYRF